MRPLPLAPSCSTASRLALRSAGLASALATAAALLVAASPAATAADTTTGLGVDYVHKSGDLAVGSGKVFVTNGEKLVAAGTDGELLGEVGGLTDASGLATAQDGAHLYVALTESGKVAEIDTATLQITRSIDLAAYPCPTHLARSGDQLWVGYGCESGDGGVVGLDLSAATPQPTAVTSDFSGAPLVAAGGGTLVVGETHTSTSSLFVYDVSSTPALRGEIDGFTHDIEGLADVAVTADGADVLAVSSPSRRTYRWDADSLEKTRTYAGATASEGFPTSVATSPDGAHVAVGGADGSDVVLYDAATGETVHGLDGTIADRTNEVAFSGTDAFAVVTASSGELYLWRMEDITFPASKLTLTSASDAVVNQPLTLAGTLEVPSGASPGAQPLTVTHRLPGGTTETLDSVTTAPDGSFTLTDTPAAGGAHTYTVLWNGDDDARWSTTSVTLTVKNISSLTATGPEEWLVGVPVTISGVLLPKPPASGWGYPLTVKRTLTNANGTVTIALPGVGARKDGTYSFTHTPTEAGLYTYTVEWAGNAGYTSAKADHEVQVKEWEE
ncbi:hypothetical protein [Nonomuraea sp. NPDC049607]|uniref:hypothetical protein n=1 Tax=Nonomuraea sp. NPDC049607 TaxID=3154732 RepID=UPI00343F6612